MTKNHEGNFHEFSPKYLFMTVSELKYCNTIRSTFSQYSSSIIKIKFVLVPTIRFEDIYFTDHYNIIIIYIILIF